MVNGNGTPLENEVLNALTNREVVTRILSQTEYYSKILPHIEVIDIDGDTAKIIGIKSREPKDWRFDYNVTDFSPREVLVHKVSIENEDKKIFWTVLSESIEKLALGDGSKLSSALAKQSHQVAYDSALFLDKDLVQGHICNKHNYRNIQKMSRNDLRDVTKVGEAILNALFQFTNPHNKFVKSGDESCVPSLKDNTLTFINYKTYAKLRMASVFSSPSPILEELNKETTIIPVPMINDFEVAIFDKAGIQLIRALTDRLLEHDKYINMHKILDHLWRKWVIVPFRCALAIKGDRDDDEYDSPSDSEEELDIEDFNVGGKKNKGNKVNKDKGVLGDEENVWTA